MNWEATKELYNLKPSGTYTGPDGKTVEYYGPESFSDFLDSFKGSERGFIDPRDPKGPPPYTLGIPKGSDWIPCPSCGDLIASLYRETPEGICRQCRGIDSRGKCG